MASVVRELERAVAAARECARGDAGFGSRCRALDMLEVHVFERLERLDVAGAQDDAIRAIRAAAEQARRALERANVRTLQTLRDDVRSGRLRGRRLEHALVRLAAEPPRRRGYDALDALVAGLMESRKPAAEHVVLGQEMVRYQPTPARVVLQLLDRARVGRQDTLYDLGSGLGRVVLLAALLRGCVAKGVEIEPAYRRYADTTRRLLKVQGASFTEGDVRGVRGASIADGTVFFLYTPFRGALLAQVLAMLCGVVERVSASGERRRPVRVATCGPCTRDVAALAASWLVLRVGRADRSEEVAVFESVRAPSPMR